MTRHGDDMMMLSSDACQTRRIPRPALNLNLNLIRVAAAGGDGILACNGRQQCDPFCHIGST